MRERKYHFCWRSPSTGGVVPCCGLSVYPKDSDLEKRERPHTKDCCKHCLRIVKKDQMWHNANHFWFRKKD